MKLWSRGLGATEISMDFRSYKVIKDPESGEVCLIGTMTDPVHWEFKITMQPDDIPGFMKVLFNPSILRLGINNAHKFAAYLWNRKEYIPEDDAEMESRVNQVYEQMMKKTRLRRA